MTKETQPVGLFSNFQRCFSSVTRETSLIHEKTADHFGTARWAPEHKTLNPERMRHIQSACRTDASDGPCVMICSLLAGWAASARVFSNQTFFSELPKPERHDTFLFCRFSENSFRKAAGREQAFFGHAAVLTQQLYCRCRPKRHLYRR